MLQHNQLLEKLNLSQCNLSNAGKMELSKAIAGKKSL
jgi:hypothetical protein